MEYFWASFVYQIIIYAFAAHLIIKFWGDVHIMVLSLAGALLYIPFTFIQMRKFKSMAMPIKNKSNAAVLDIQTHVSNKYILLLDFFRFKKRYDYVGVPVSCFIMVMLFFSIYIKGGIREHLMAGLISYLIVLAVFILVIYFENKKRFKYPLQKLQLILEDIKNNIS